MNQLLKMMSCSLILASVFVFIISGTASAHVLKTSNGVSGVLHIPPDDNPPAGQPVKLGITFASANHSFNLANCDCSAVVKNNGTAIQTMALRPALDGATVDAEATVEFPAANVYDVFVKGSAKDGSFSAFQLDYVVRVSGVPAGSQVSASRKGGDILVISAGSLAVLGLVAYTTISYGGRYQPKPAAKPDGKKVPTSGRKRR